MSIEGATPLPESKQQKHKDGSQKKSKKRRREEEDRQNPADVGQAKKRKKEKRERKEKKDKKNKNGSHEVTPGVSNATTKLASASNDAAVDEQHQQQQEIESQELSKSLATGSPFVQQTTSFYLALAPVAHAFPLEGLCAEHISPLLLTYYPPLKGVVLSYGNVRLSEHPEEQSQATNSAEAQTVLSRSVDEYAVSYVWLTADFVLLRPRRGTWLEGHVNLQNESILGLMCYNYFSAGIERQRLPKDWQWVGDESTQRRDRRKGGEGFFVTEQGKKIDGRIVFQVKDFEAHPGGDGTAGSVNVVGTLLGNDDDRRLDDEDRQAGMVKDTPARRRPSF